MPAKPHSTTLQKNEKSRLLIDNGETLFFQAALACAIGDRRAIALQQIHYWVDHNAKSGKKMYLRGGMWWCYNTWREWQERNFPMWSVSTIRRIFTELEAIGLVVTQPHDKQKNGLWVTINYGAVELLQDNEGERIRVRRPGNRVQNEQGTLSKLNTDAVQNEQAASDTDTTETNTNKEIAAIAAVKPKVTRAERDALTNAMGEHLFGLTSQAAINMAARRINGLIKMVSADKLPTPADVAAFVKWYQRECPRTSLPTGNDTFPVWWAQWLDKRAARPRAAANVFSADNPPPADSVITRPDVPQDADLAEFLRSRSEVMYG